MPLPVDIHRMLSKSVSESFNLFSHSVTWKYYVSASAGTPEAGIGDSWCYQLRPGRADLKPLTFEEIQMIGGQNIIGGYRVYSQVEPQNRDEMIYDGQTYRAISQPIHAHIGNPLWWETVFVAGDVTGLW